MEVEDVEQVKIGKFISQIRKEENILNTIEHENKKLERKNNIFFACYIALLVLILIALGIGACWLLDNSIFSKADPIRQMQMDEIESFRVFDVEGDEIIIDDAEKELMITYINNAVPTEKWSVNDFPPVSQYYKVEIELVDEERMYRYFIYEEDGSVFVELPYSGVYEIFKGVLNLFE